MTISIFGERGVKLGLIVAITIPSLAQMKLQSSSFASGLLMASSMILLAALLIVSIKPRLLVISLPILFWMLSVFSFIFTHYLVSAFFASLPQDLVRFIGSIAILPIFFSAAFIVSASLTHLNQIAVRRILHSICFILAANAVLSLTGIDYLGVATNKPTFLFSEPSHFALITSPFLIYYMKSRSRGWGLFFLLFLVYAIFIQNLTMLIATLLAAIVSFRFKKIILMLPILFIFFATFANVEYFSNRLLFSQDELNNISLLVVLQGWQNALFTLFDTSGWGVGYQQFGIASLSGDLTEKLSEILNGSKLNELDGGTTAVKLLGEFGLFGLLIVVALIVRATKAFFILNRGMYMSDLFIFARCVEISILTELFLRGVGYYSPTIFIYLIMFFWGKLMKVSKAAPQLCQG